MRGKFLLPILVMTLLVLVMSGGSTGSDRFVTFESASAFPPSFRIYPSAVTQTETFITRHPTNPKILFASANTINLSTGFVSEGVYATTDGGQHWFGSDTCKGAPITFHRGDPGIAIDRNGTFILVRLGFSPGLYSHFSTDVGVTWSPQKTVVTNDQDRGTIASDVSSTSPFHGRTYAAWVRFEPPFPVFVAFTDDGASNWSVPVRVNNPSQRGQGGEVAVGRNGAVNVCWAAVINSSPFTEDFVGFASSTDGGVTWNVRENAFDVNGIAGTLPSKGNIRVNGLPRIDIDRTGGPRSGWIYIVTTQRNLSPAGSDSDIILNRSTDGGVSWSSGIRVNQDPLNNGKTQYFPAIHVDDAGGVNIVYYDDRNTTTDSTGVFLSRSTDGGDTWSDLHISDHNFKPTPIGGLGQGYQGDNIGVTSVGNILWPIWMDNSTGTYQAWVRAIDLITVDVKETHSIYHPSSFVLKQNYPNPFNPSTMIEYEIRNSGHVTLDVYDIAGKAITTLVDERQSAGTYRVVFEAMSRLKSPVLPTGIYYYRLTAGGMTETRSMVLVK